MQMSEEEQHHETPSIRSGTSLTNSSPGTTRIVQGMISDILSQHDRVKKSNLKKLHKIGDYEFGDLDYQQIEIWTKEYNLSSEEIIRRFTIYKTSQHWYCRNTKKRMDSIISSIFVRCPDEPNLLVTQYPVFGSELEFRLIVNDGKITTLPWDTSLLNPRKKFFLENLSIEELIIYDGSKPSYDYTEKKARNISYLSIQGRESKEITLSLSNLRQLVIENYTIQHLSLSGCANLSSLICDGIDLVTLRIAGLKHLESLSCDDNLIDERDLDLSGLIKLSKLSCRNNILNELNTKNNPNLTELCCSDNVFIKQLDLCNNPRLKILQCAHLDLRRLDLSNLADLRILDCRANPLKEIDITHNQKLEYLLCNPEVKIKKVAEQSPLIITDEF